LISIRCIDEHGEADQRRPPPSEEHRLWGNHYNGPLHVVFGHNARTEPQFHHHATGIDTGCVYGGRLTALVLAANESVAIDTRERQAQLVSVPARKTYLAIE
jgi:hypothetical protein